MICQFPMPVIETQLITVINDWAKILDKGGQIDTFIFDLNIFYSFCKL